MSRTLRLVRADAGCCTIEVDRRTCGAHVSRRRAERAHVVVTNHAFALARRDLFRHLVFDECEHLHDVAHDAFSHAVNTRVLRDELERLHRALERVGKKVLPLGGGERRPSPRR